MIKKCKCELSSDLGTCRFGVTTDGRPGYKKAGADTVYPFKQLHKFTTNWTWNSSGTTPVNIDLKSVPGYASLTINDMVPALTNIRGGVRNTGAPVYVIIRSASYDSSSGIATINVGYETWDVTSITGTVVLSVVG